MSRLRWPRKKRVSPLEPLWTDSEPTIGPGEAVVLEARMDMEATGGTRPGVLSLTNERIAFRLLDTPHTVQPSLIVEALGTVRIGYPASGTRDEFILVFRRGDAEIPLRLRRPEHEASDDSFAVMFDQLRRLLGA